MKENPPKEDETEEDYIMRYSNANSRFKDWVWSVNTS